MDLKIQRQIESAIQDQLYSNLYLLSKLYPATKEFHRLLKKDMFVKPNIAAFQHVSHFLLNVIDPVKFKETFEWPILDKKMEAKFRNDLVKYVEELNSLSDEFYIPVLLTSHLIAPNGYRFMEFMLKLSQFVTIQCLRRENVSALLPPTADENSDIADHQTNIIKKITDNRIATVSESYYNFKQKLDNSKQLAEGITEKMENVNEKIHSLTNTIETLKTKLQNSLTDSSGIPIEQKLLNYTSELETFSALKEGLSECVSLMRNVSVHRQSKVDKPSQDLITENMSDVFETLEKFIRKLNYFESLEVGCDLNDYAETLEQRLETLSSCWDICKKVNETQNNFLANLQQNVVNVECEENCEVDDNMKRCMEIIFAPSY